jgi:tRNA 5-methylaminomethyl-2-thiouridine biosynthesis bifunctional protein
VIVHSVLDWQDGQPFSRRFGDIYFSREGGLAETRHVFLAGNRLPERFAELGPAEAFVIGETGFGTALNFLAAWQLFASTAPPDARLHFVSTELDPLPPHDLEAALRLWPELAAQRQALLAQYATPAPGWHRFAFDAGRVRLTLLIGDARATLPAMQGEMDAWFLDGFAPARNPQLWEPALLAAIGRQSRPGATAASYSCAGDVRRALAAAGFRVWKAAGYGRKREMLQAWRDGVPRLPGSPARRAALVVGGGLAGTAVARSLAERGWRVTLLETGGTLASGASGNPQGVLYARLSAQPTPLRQLVLAGYQHTLRVLRTHLSCDGDEWSDAPVLQLAFDAREAARHEAIAALGLPAELVRRVPADEARRIAGLAIEHPALLFPQGGWAHPPALCRALAAHPRIEVRLARAVPALLHAGEDWEARDGEQLIGRAPVAVIAAGTASLGFAPAAHLPLGVNRGQLTLVPQTAASAALHAVLCGDGYVTPARRGVHCVGASFARERRDDLRAADDADNLARLARLAPALHSALGEPAAGSAGLRARAGLRCTSPDYLPVVGPLGARWPGLLISAAHGSRGLLSAPLAGEVLAACLEAEPAPLEAAMMQALLPQRFG